MRYIYCSFINKFQLVGSFNKLFYLLQISKQNYPNDLRIGCKPFSNLVELIKANAKLEEELEELKEHLKGMRFWKYNLL
jgi:hypothetical protein